MNEKFLVAAGFSPVSVKGDASIKPTGDVDLNISFIKPNDHSTPQMVLKVNRNILKQMNLEISDRVKIMVGKNSKTLIVMKGSHSDKNTFAVSCQGAKLEEAIKSQRGGTVKVGWREEFGDWPIFYGTYPSKAHLIDDALIVQIP